MAKCNCGAQTCGCRITEGTGVAITGSGTARDPWVISVDGGGGGSTGWAPGDLKDTVRSVTDAGWLECNGQAVSRATYAGLFAAIGTACGNGDGVNTFNLPNFAGVFRMGAGPGYPAGASGGAASTTLAVANLPPHHHTISHNHTMAHNHTINHDHANATTADAGNHTHDLNRSNEDGTNNNTVRRGAGNDGNIGTGGGGVHDHAVNIPSYTGNSGAASNPTTSAPNVPNSGTTGAGAAFTNLPPFRAVRVLIKT